MKINKRIIGVISFISVIMLHGCGGGGGGGGAGGPTGPAPILSDVSISPSEAAAGLTITLSGSFTFSDSNGDLGGGTFNYTYDNATFSLTLPSSFDGITSGTAYFDLDVVLSATTGTMSIPCWLIDRAGNQSNTFEVSFTQLWTRQLGTVYEDIGEAVAVDSSNSVYVAGSTNGDLDGNINTGMKDVFLTKFNSSSAKEWTKLLGSTSDDYAMGVAVDSNNDVYITGCTLGDEFDGNVTAGGTDIFLTKYDPSGNKLWTELLGTADSDLAYGITVDSDNNIYITGETTGDLDGNTNTGSWDIFLAKYDASGTKIWTRLLGTTDVDCGYAIAVDSGDSIYVTGGTCGVLGVDPSPGDPQINYDVFLAKYDTSGNKQWVSQIGTSCTELGYGVSADSSGNIYVSGRVYLCALDGNVAYGGYDAFLAKVDSSGNMQWIRQFGTAEHDKGQALTTDKNNNVYVVGYLNSYYFTDDNEGRDVFLAKYSTLGDELWVVQENGGYDSGDQGRGVATDTNNDIYLTGTTHGHFDEHTNPNYGEDDVFILKYDADGTKR